jgi:hypothetical protein
MLVVYSEATKWEEIGRTEMIRYDSKCLDGN